MLNFFIVEATSQNTTALGFAVLNIPEYNLQADGRIELSSYVNSPNGVPLDGVVCFADLKVTCFDHVYF